MNTQPDVDIRRGNEPQCFGLTATAIPEVNGSQTGDYVRIIDGPFKGIEGRVTKITGQKRVIVELPGLCSVATAYVPKGFIISLC